MIEYEDVERTCRTCGVAFTWTRGEQAWLANKGLTPHPPRECKECRAARKEREQADYGYYATRGR